MPKPSTFHMGYPGSQFHCGPDYINDPLASFLVSISDPFASFGPQDVRFLAAITVLEGTGNNALSAIVTGAVTTPYLIQILSTDGEGVIQTWALIASSLATGPGVQRPNDWSVSNAKVWVMLA